MSEHIHVVTDLPKPSFLSRIPVKTVAVTTILVGASILVAAYAKDHVDVETVVETVKNTTD